MLLATLTGNINVKICSRCETPKALKEFYINPHYAGGYTARCRSCIAAAAKEWAAQNPERRRDVRLNWNQRNKEHKRQSSAALRQRKLTELGDALREHERTLTKRWRKNNPTAASAIQIRSYRKRCKEKPDAEKKRRARARERMLQHPVRGIAYKLSGRVRVAIKMQAGKKAWKTKELIGCTVPELIAHIERQFQPGMTWENWGRGVNCWHLDHKRPVSSFDLTDPQQQKLCFHYTNYQPLWAIDNIRKGNKWAPDGALASAA